MRVYSVGLLVPAVCLAGLLAAASPVSAQQFNPLDDGLSGDLFLPSGDAGQQDVTVTAQFTKPAGEKPGRLFITATIEPGWHIYSITQPKGGPLKTIIKIQPSDAFELLGDFAADPPPLAHTSDIFQIRVEEHYGGVTWSAPIRLADPAGAGKLEIEGVLEGQACHQSGRCVQISFPLVARLGQPPASAIREEHRAPASEPLDLGSLATMLGFAFLGGLILNLMPCVLPVISLKILSFLEHGGQRRGRVFMLNVWYALGLLSVFMVLASLAAFFRFGWGEQFTLPWFKVAMTGLVFVMALSFLGVWELPVPGFAGRGKAGELQAREGAAGAFAKGVFTTILATPCTGPGLALVFGFVLKQPPAMAFLIFGFVGLGMASPYLMIGAFPGLIRFLPKPGAWMETLKEVMAFLLLGTVVYLFTTMTETYFVPTLTFLTGLWLACWWIGRTPITASRGQKVFAWAGSILIATAVGVFAFTLLLRELLLPWQPFSPEALAWARAEQKTVMVDFTANWCPNCKWNMAWAIDTRPVLEVVEENGVVTLKADWTDRSPMIKKALNDLGYNSIPLLAIWPAGGPDHEVIVLPDLLTESQVLDALNRAGPSKGSLVGQE